jgi:hypothetical protein
MLHIVHFFLHYTQSPQISQVSQQDLFSTKGPTATLTIHTPQKGQPSRHPHSTYTKLGQSPYKHPNPKRIRFIHFLLDLIPASPRSNRCSKSTLVHFTTALQQFVHIVIAFLGASFPLFPALFFF